MKLNTKKIMQWTAILAVFILLIYFTFPSENPVLQFAFDLSLIVLGVITCYGLVENYKIKGRFFDLLGAILIAVALIGFVFLLVLQ